MPFVDRVRSLLSRISNGPYDKDKPTESNLANGGHTGYHPLPPKKQRMKEAYSEQMNSYPNPYAGAAQGYPMDGTSVDAAQQGAWQDPNGAYAQPWGQGWQQNDAAAQQGAWGQGWQQQAQSWQVDPSQQGTMAAQAFAQGGYPGQADPMQQTGFAQQATGYAYQNAGPASQQTAYTAQAGGFAQQQGGGFARGQNPSQSQPQRPVSSQSGPVNMGQMHYMPGQFVHEDGSAYTHVERLAQPLSSSSCFRLIDFMRNGESIIVNTELIQDERENSHCLDLLYGAAFTMGYTFTKISRMKIYLISPGNICVLPYGTIKQMNDEEVSRRWPGSVPQAQNQAPAGFDFDRLDRKAAGGMENYTPQRRYS